MFFTYFMSRSYYIGAIFRRIDLIYIYLQNKHKFV